MSKNKDAWGIEVGSQAIKAIKLSQSGSGVTLEDFEVLPFKQVLTTPDLDVEEAIRVNLESLAQKHEFDKSNVTVSVPGNMAFARFAKLPPVEQKNVKSIVAYEAQQQIPFPINEVEWDYEVFAQDDAPDIEVGIFAITKERVAHFLSNYRVVNVRVDALTLSPVAVYNAFAYENEADSGLGDNTVYLDIGTNSTDIIVVEAGSIWLRTLQLGGNHFTQALMKQLKITHAKAEKLKLEARTSKYAKHIFTATRGVMNELVTEIQRSLGFYTSLNRDAELTKIVGVGSTWKLPGLQKYLKQNLQMDVVRPDGFKQLQIDDRRDAEFSSVAANMATAYGLALQGLGLGAVEANILPQSILQQRMLKAKQPWIAAAAACVAAAPLLGFSMLKLADNSYQGTLSNAKPGIDRTLTEARSFKEKYDLVQTNDPRPGITNIRRSFDYMNLVPGLIDDVSQAIATIEPNPALNDVDWNNPEAVERLSKISRADRKIAQVIDIQTRYIPPTVEEESDETSGSSGSGSGGAYPDYYGSAGSSTFSSSSSTFSSASGADSDRSDVDVALLPLIPFPTPPVSQAAGTQEGSDDAADEPVEDTVSPRMSVTVRVATTMNRQTISRLVQEKFVGWLEANAERPDRPYIIIPELPEDSISFNRKVVGTPQRSSSDNKDQIAPDNNDLRTTPTPKEARPTTRPTPGIIPQGGGVAGLDPNDLTGRGGSADASNEKIEIKTPEGWYASFSSSQVSFSPNALLPRRPLSIEDQTKDSIYTFSFDVILLPPDDARPTILYEPGQETPPEDEGAASQPQAGANQATPNTEEQA